jgi:hypothetical protein
VNLSAEHRDIIRIEVIALFEKKGSSIVEGMGTRAFFERSSNMPHFQEVLQAWQNACVTFLVGAEKMNQGATLQEDLFLFLFAINPPLALQSFHPLICDRAKAADLQFFNRFAIQQRKRRGRPKVPQSLSLLVLQYWIHGFLWLLSRNDRASLINHRLENTLDSRSKDPLSLVKQCSERLGLLGWSDFPSTYRSEPFIYKAFSGATDYFEVSDRWEVIFSPAS